jgi:hypothetical protein
MSASPRYLQLLDEMRDPHVRKSAGYAGGAYLARNRRDVVKIVEEIARDA